MPRFSILVPVYNVQDYLGRCLDSILSQSFDDYEVVLVNDGSTDDSLRIGQRYAEQDSRFRVVSQQNEGLLRARRRGLQEARGEYVLFLDSDDFWEPNALSSINESLNRSTFAPDLLIFNFYRYFGEHDRRKREPVFRHGALFDASNKAEFVKAWIHTGDLNAMWTKAVKRSCIDIDDHYDDFVGLSTGEDLLQSIYIVDHSHTIMYIDKPLYNYRVNEGSITHSFSLQKIHQLVRVREQFWRFLQGSYSDRPDLLSEYLNVSAEILSGYLLDVYAYASVRDISACNRQCGSSWLLPLIKRNGLPTTKTKIVTWTLSGNHAVLASMMGRLWKAIVKREKCRGV